MKGGKSFSERAFRDEGTIRGGVIFGHCKRKSTGVVQEGPKRVSATVLKGGTGRPFAN